MSYVKRLDRLEALIAAGVGRREQKHFRVTALEPDELLDQMVAAGEITDAERDAVFIVHLVAPSTSDNTHSRMPT